MGSGERTDWENDIKVVESSSKIYYLTRQKYRMSSILSLKELGKTWQVKFQMFLPHSKTL